MIIGLQFGVLNHFTSNTSNVNVGGTVKDFGGVEFGFIESCSEIPKTYIAASPNYSFCTDSQEYRCVIVGTPSKYCEGYIYFRLLIIRNGSLQT